MIIPPIISEMFGAVQQSVMGLHARISDVKPAGFKNGEELIAFKLDDVMYVGALRGRNRDLCIGFSEDADRGIACRVFIDGHASLHVSGLR